MMSEDSMEARMQRLQDEARARALLDDAKALHPDFDPSLDRVVRVKPTEQPPLNPPKPFKVKSQVKLFKAGLMGTAVTVWSKVGGENGHEPTQVMQSPGEPLVVQLDNEHAEDVISFAAGYVYGWVESVNGDLDQLDIWLETQVTEGNTK